MGSGKSTIGKKISEKLNYSFIDTDEFIEETEQRQIKDIFSNFGEQYFRELETKSLTEIDTKVIATGGGIVEREKNIDIMRENGKVIFLNVPFKDICNRLKNDISRPLWNENIQKSEALYNSRLPKYFKAASYVVNTEGKRKSEIVDEIINEVTIH